MNFQRIAHVSTGAVLEREINEKLELGVELFSNSASVPFLLQLHLASTDSVKLFDQPRDQL